MNQKIAILGAGLSGLYLAKVLRDHHFDVHVFEARNRIGGRIFTKLSSLETRVEMGATWFGHQHKHLMQLIQELEIGYFEQYMHGTAYFEAFSTAPPQAIEIPNEVPSFRIKGGSSALIESLASYLPKESIHLNYPIQTLHFENDTVILNKNLNSFSADCVISTLPPALFFHSIQTFPALPNEVNEVAQTTHTWMQDSTKVAFVYKEPFWRNRNQSGTIFSNVGPLTECYDQCDFTNQHFALCGFLGGYFSHLTASEREERCKNQLLRVFGEQALSYLSYEETQWFDEIHSKHPNQNRIQVFPHQNNGHRVYQDSYFDSRLYLGGTETSNQFPGYMEGALIASERILRQITSLNKTST